MSQIIKGSTPAEDGFYMPAEFSPQDEVFMVWPERTDNWRNGAKPAQAAYARVAKAISEFTPVTMMVSTKQFAHAREILPPEIRVVEVSTNDAWCRDTGPTFVIDRKGHRRAIDWTFNAWGGLVDGTGTCPKIAGIYENGFESLHRSFGRGSLNTGRPANLTYNLGDNTTITMHGQDIVTQEPDPFSQYVYYSQTGIINDGGIMNAGDNLNITSDVQGIYTLNASGINNTKYGQMHIGDNAGIKASGTLAKLSSGDGAEVYGIISRHNHVWEDESTNKGPQVITLGKNAKITVDFNSLGTDTESPSSIMGAAIRLSTTDFTADNHLHLISTQENSGIGTYGCLESEPGNHRR